MKFHKPIGQAVYGPLFIRVSLGAYFVMAGLAKLDDHKGFIDQVHQANILPDLLATLYGIVLPYCEVAAGGLFVVGLWTVMAGSVLSLLLVSFIIALGIFPSAGPFNKDIILLGAALSVLYTGAGAVSIDRFREKGG